MKEWPLKISVTIIALLFCSGFNPLFSQDFITVDSSQGVFLPEIVLRGYGLGDVCDDSLIVENGSPRIAYDIMVLPNGDVYGYGVRNGFFDTTIYKVGLVSGLTDFYNFALTVDPRIRGLTCDETGYYYTAGEGITKQHTDFFLLDEQYLGDLPPTMHCQGDMTYRQGKFYLHSINNQLVEVNMKDPSKSKAVMDFPPGTLPIDGLATVQLGCDSVATYAIGRTPTNSKIYEINFGDWTLTELCDLPISITGAGSQTECMLPPCDIFLDLDSDNSSFAFRGDFCADTFCVPPVAVADTDVVIISAFAGLESIVLELTGALDPGQEYLSVGPVNNITVVGNNTTLLTLQDNGNATVADFEDAVRAVQYFNGAATVSYGTREVYATAFAGGESSLVSVAELPLSNGRLEVQADVTEPTCIGFLDGVISVAASGGATPYTYQWGASQTGPSIGNLPAGAYFLTTTDAVGCAKKDTVFLNEPDTLIAGITYSGLPAICDSSRQLAAMAAGGSGQLSFLWSNGVTDSLNANVGPGSHGLAVLDTNGCMATAFYDIPEGDSILMIENGSVCEGEGFGWNGITYFTDTLACQVTVLPNGCDSTVCLSLTVNPLPNAVIDVNGNFCASGEITLSAGQHDSYLWSTGKTTAEITVTAPGSYAVTVTNAFGCGASAAVTVNPAIGFDLFFENPSCFGETDGTITVENATGGTPPLLFSIDGGNQFFPDGSFNGLPAGDYLLVVEDAEGCREEMPVLLEAPPPITLDAGGDLEIGLGESIVLGASTNLVDPIVLWQPPDYLDCAGCLVTEARPLATIQYGVEVFDSNGCSASDVLTVTVNDLSSTYVPTAFSPNGDGTNDFFTVFAGQSVTEVLSLKVFDRWGGLLFDKGNFPPNVVEEGWDGLTNGRPAAAGTYVFIAEMLRVDGEPKVVSGEVNLVR